MMTRHAFLILAHDKFDILRILLGRLDDTRNDVFIHFDRKVGRIPELKTERAGLFVLDRRIDVRWGGFSMVEAEEALFEAAVSRGPYGYYHLLSGVDLPIKSQDYIHGFFDRFQGKEFIGYTYTEMVPMVEERMRYWYMFQKKFRGYNAFEYYIREASLDLQQALGLKRNKRTEFLKGPQWVSVTHGMARLFLSSMDWIRRTFNHTLVPDECVFQTLCWYSPFKENIFCLDNGAKGSLRLVGWRADGSLTDWSSEDYMALASSEALFARKFNGSDPEFLKRVLRLSEPEVV